MLPDAVSEQLQRNGIRAYTAIASLMIGVGVGTSRYQGVSRSENVDVLDVKSASPTSVAMVVERSDHAALSGTTLFVFVSDHVYSIPELRRGLFGLDAVFVAGGAGVSISWSSPSELTIRCDHCGITKEIIEKQKFVLNDVAVRYEQFP